jgi:hypothetical protein
MYIRIIIAVINLLLMFLVISRAIYANSEKSFILFGVYYGLLLVLNAIIVLILQIKDKKIGAFLLKILFVQIILFFFLLVWFMS